MEEKEAVAIMAANLKGSKVKPSNLLEFAEACRTLKTKWNNSIPKVADFFKVSSYMIRQIDRINDLSPPVKKLVKENEIGIDTAYQLSRLGKEKQLETSKYVIDLNAMQARWLIDLVLENPKTSVSTLRKEIDQNRDRKVHVLIIPVVESTYARLKEQAKLSKLPAHDIVLRLIEDYLDGQEKKNGE